MKGKVISIVPDLLNGGYVVVMHVNEITSDTVRMRNEKDITLNLVRNPNDVLKHFKAFEEVCRKAGLIL